MKILVIDNAAINERNDRFYVYKSTGEFGSDLQGSENKVEFFQFSNKSNSSISSYDLEKNNIRFTICKMYKSKALRYMQAYLKGFFRILRNDFIYVYYPNSFFPLVFISKVLGKKYGLYIRGEVGIYSKRSQQLYKNAEVIFTVSDGFTNYINDLSPSKKAYTIKPMIAYTAADIVQNRHYEKKERYNILFLGRIDKDKGLFELIDAVKALKQTTTLEFDINIVGDGPYLNELENKAKALDIADVVTFHGAISDKDKIMEKYLEADIYILPTYHEGFPRTLYEAMMFGTPIITTLVGGIPGLMKDGFNCFKIDAKSSDSIVEKITYALENYDKAVEFAQNGKATISRVFEERQLSHAQHLNKIINKR
jgi:glycosyltransferase involved in cell wall biosynthesis